MLETYCLARRTRVLGCSWCAQMVGSCDVSALGLGDTEDAVQPFPPAQLSPDGFLYPVPALVLY